MAGQGMSGAGYASIATNTITSIMSSKAETSAFVANVNRMADAKTASMKSAVTSFELEQMKLGEQIDQLDEVMGEKLSARGLQALKDRAKLKAASAETGTTGGTTDYAIQEAYMTEHFDQANIIQEGRMQQKALMTNMDIGARKLSVDLAGLASGMPEVNTSSAMAAIQAGLGVATGSMQGMTDSDKVSMFDIKAT